MGLSETKLEKGITLLGIGSSSSHFGDSLVTYAVSAVGGYLHDPATLVVVP